MERQRQSRVTAVLGPTNTGKTHLAVERMLGHRTGVIGLPLRLLAREVYDKVVAAKGENAAALITGEEKIVPGGARYFICTVESMPVGRAFDFLAVDEVQLAADPERGHIFTERLLEARGSVETMFLGSDALRPILRRLVPEVEFISRPRLSNLTFSGYRKLARLPPRSAVVSFSAQDVYSLAESLRRHRGGAAVVLGALSPRTRNAQVAMFESGEVDYMVATDAVGMGLNLNVDHLAFAARAKFDGFTRRDLAAHEVAQIAGRSGRYLRDGTFGATLDCPEFDAPLVENVENHRFKDIRAVYWRSGELDFSSAGALLDSLKAPPPEPWRRLLMRPKRALDAESFAALSAARPVAGETSVRLLWEVCQIPDFRKTMMEAHTRLLARIYEFLAGASRQVPTDWIADQIARLDRMEGDIDMLAARIAHVRTWTYVCHRGDWVPNSAHWQERARAVEDRLSDALHDRLTQRFVDRRSAVLMRTLGGTGHSFGSVQVDGEVVIDGHSVGRLDGFRFVPDPTENDAEVRLLHTAAQRTLGAEITARVGRLRADQPTAFALDGTGQILWGGNPVARLVPGHSVTAPRLVLADNDLLEGSARIGVEERLGAWLNMHLEQTLAPLRKVDSGDLKGAARGLAYQVTEGLGSVPRPTVADQVAALAPKERSTLRSLGLRFGALAIYLPTMFRPDRALLCCQLWALHNGLEPMPKPPTPGLVSLQAEPDVPSAYYAAAGYRVIGARAVRIDMLERLSLAVRRLAQKGPVKASPELRMIIGCRPTAFDDVMAAIGFRKIDTVNGPAFEVVPRPRQRALAPPGNPAKRSRSPFAVLAGHPAHSQSSR